MLFYFIAFTFLGFLITNFIKDDEQKVFIIFIVIAVLWGIAFKPIWGLVSLGEMALGFFITKILNK